MGAGVPAGQPARADGEVLPLPAPTPAPGDSCMSVGPCGSWHPLGWRSPSFFADPENLGLTPNSALVGHVGPVFNPGPETGTLLSCHMGLIDPSSDSVAGSIVIPQGNKQSLPSSLPTHISARYSDLGLSSGSVAGPLSNPAGWRTWPEIPWPNCVASVKSYNLDWPQFPHLTNGSSHRDSPIW